MTSFNICIMILHVYMYSYLYFQELLLSSMTEQ